MNSLMVALQFCFPLIHIAPLLSTDRYLAWYELLPNDPIVNNITYGNLVVSILDKNLQKVYTMANSAPSGDNN